MKIKILIMLIIVFLFSCEDTENPFSGITVTKIGDEGIDSYIIISEDEDDWKISYTPERSFTYSDVATIGPAYPNPTSNIVYFPVVLEGDNHLHIYVKDISGKIVAEVYNDSLQAGYYTSWISWNLRDMEGKALPSGLYRSFYEWDKVEKDTTRVATGYGDIQIE